MEYTANAERAAVAVRKALEVTTSGAGRIDYRLSSARAAPVSVTVVDQIEAVETVGLPAADRGRWTLSESTLEYRVRLEPNQTETAVVRFRTDAPEAVADARSPPGLRVDGAADATADRPTGDTSDETGGFEFPHATDSDGRSDDGTEQSGGPRAIPPAVDPLRAASVPDHPTSTADARTAPLGLDREREFSMPDDEYTEAELIATGADRRSDDQ